MKQEQGRSTRASYEKPEVRRIKLVPEEMAATGCKTANGPGRTPRCSFGAGRCSAIGS
jgi:hypothetical protein